MSEYLKIKSVRGFKDNDRLMSIKVEFLSEDITHVLMSIEGKKTLRNIIREISSGISKIAFEQETIEGAQCVCGEQVTIRAFCLADSSISDSWTGELPCFGREEEAALAAATFEEEGKGEGEFPEQAAVGEPVFSGYRGAEEEEGIAEALPLEGPGLEEKAETAEIEAIPGLEIEEEPLPEWEAAVEAPAMVSEVLEEEAVIEEEKIEEIAAVLEPLETPGIEGEIRTAEEV
ncbi:MAG: hypothetical protein AB1585_01630, partial [Thermodesulfobacteriota bacterium]